MDYCELCDSSAAADRGRLRARVPSPGFGNHLNPNPQVQANVFMCFGSQWIVGLSGRSKGGFFPS